MGRARKGGSLALWMNGLRVGTWAVSSQGQHELRYDPRWVRSPRGRPVSLSMPLRQPEDPYRGAVVRDYFENLLPDNRLIRERIRTRFGARSTQAFELLAQVGRDCVGALQLLPEDQEPSTLQSITGTPLSESQVAQLLRDVMTTGRHTDDDAFRISLAGAQEKTALLLRDGQWWLPSGSTPTTHILKLPLGIAPSGIDLRTSVQNEWLCARLLAAYGVSVSQCHIVRFEEHEVLAVSRFDRQWATDNRWIVRIPQEDFAQFAGVPPELKYEADGGPGIRFILNALLGSTNAETDRQDFFRTQVLFWMLAAIDGHAKNFSIFIEPRGRYRLTPRYDVLSAYPVLGRKHGQLDPKKIKMAMAVWGVNRHSRWSEIHRKHFEYTARDCGLGAQADQWIADIIEQTPRALEVVARELPHDFPDSVAQPILDGVAAAAARLHKETIHL